MLPAWATVVLSFGTAAAGVLTGVAVTYLRIRFDRRDAADTRRHERELGDLNELRKVLDDASRALTAAEVAASHAVALWAGVAMTPGDTALQKEADDAGHAYWNAQHEARAESRRVAIRLPSGHPVTVAYFGAVEALYKDVGTWLEGAPHPPGQLPRFNRAGVERDRYALRASELVGSRLPAVDEPRSPAAVRRRVPPPALEDLTPPPLERAW